MLIPYNSCLSLSLFLDNPSQASLLHLSCVHPGQTLKSSCVEHPPYPVWINRYCGQLDPNRLSTADLNEDPLSATAPKVPIHSASHSRSLEPPWSPPHPTLWVLWCGVPLHMRSKGLDPWRYPFVFLMYIQRWTFTLASKWSCLSSSHITQFNNLLVDKVDVAQVVVLTHLGECST